MQHALQATLPCSRWYDAIQNVVCCQALTSKPLVGLHFFLFVQLLLWGHRFSVPLHGCSFLVKCGNTWKSTHPLLWWTWKVLQPWVHFHKTTVHIYIYIIYKPHPAKYRYRKISSLILSSLAISYSNGQAHSPCYMATEDTSASQTFQWK